MLETKGGQLDVKLRQFQRDILNDKNRFKVAVVHRRAGKTVLGLLMMLIGCARPNRRYWYIAPTYRAAKMIAWEELKHLLPPAAKINEVELSAIFPNGSRIELKGAENPDALRGAGLNGVVLDEFSEQQPKLWTEIVLPMLADHRGWAFIVGTPKGKNRFYELYQDAKTKDGWKSWLYKASDTNIIGASELQQLRESMAPEEYQQEFECSFLTYAGLVFKEFDPAFHTFKVPQVQFGTDWGRYIGIDFGYRDPTAIVWVAVSPQKDFYIYREWYKTEQTLTDVKEAILNMTGQEQIRARIGDSARPDSIEQLNRWGVATMPSEKGQNSVVDGINMLKSLFKIDGYTHKPKLYIAESCPELIRELKLYAYKEPEDGKPMDEKPIDMFNHAIDAVRYVVGHVLQGGMVAEHAQENLEEIYDLGY